MDQLDRQKEFSMAMNGRMALLITGIMNIVTAVTSSTLYAANMFVAVNGFIHGDPEFMEIFSKEGMSIGLAVAIGIAFALAGLVEIFSGVCAIRFSNRVDKASFTFKVANFLLIAEVVVQIFLVFVGMMNIPQLISVVLMPLIMIWGASRLKKLAKLDPERVYAIEPKGVQGKRTAAQNSSRSLHERAAMKAHAWDEGEQRAALAAQEKENPADETPEKGADE